MGPADMPAGLSLGQCGLQRRAMTCNPHANTQSLCLALAEWAGRRHQCWQLVAPPTQSAVIGCSTAAQAGVQPGISAPEGAVPADAPGRVACRLFYSLHEARPAPLVRCMCCAAVSRLALARASSAAEGELIAMLCMHQVHVYSRCTVMQVTAHVAFASAGRRQGFGWSLTSRSRVCQGAGLLCCSEQQSRH